MFGITHQALGLELGCSGEQRRPLPFCCAGRHADVDKEPGALLIAAGKTTMEETQEERSRGTGWSWGSSSDDGRVAGIVQTEEESAGGIRLFWTREVQVQ